MPPLFDGDIVTSITNIGTAVTRFLGTWSNYGRGILGWSQPLKIADFCLLPGTGLLFTLVNHNYILIYSFSDRVVSYYAGTGEYGATDGHRLHASFHDPLGLCHASLDDSILICDSHNSLIRRISKTDQVYVFAGGKNKRVDGLRISAGFSRPHSIAALGNGSFLVSESEENLRMISADGYVTTIKIGKFMNKSIAHSGCTVYSRFTGHPMVCSSQGLFDVRTSGSADLIVSAKVLGFVPLKAVEVRMSIFIVSDGREYFYVDVSQLAQGEAIVRQITGSKEGQDDGDVESEVVSHPSAMVLDSSTSKVYFSIVHLAETSIAELELNNTQMNSIPHPSQTTSSSSSAPSSETLDTTPSQHVFDSKSKEANDLFSMSVPTAITNSAPACLRLGEPYGTSLFMEVSPTGHVLTSRMHGMFWYDEEEGSSKPLAGNALQPGLRDGSRFDALFDSLGCICFHRIIKDALPDGFSTNEGNSSSTMPDISASSSTFMRKLIGSEHSLLVADSGNHRIRDLALDGYVSTWLGSVEGTRDGPKSVATLNRPLWIRNGNDGDLFITETFGFRIRHVNRLGLVHTLVTNLERVVRGVHSVSAFSHIQSLAVSGSSRLLYMPVGGIIFTCKASSHFSELLERRTWPENHSSASNSLVEHFCASQWSEHANIHRDGHIRDSGFGQVIRLAVPNCAKDSPCSSDVYAIDVQHGTLRRIRNSQVETLLCRAANNAHITEGFPDRARFSSPIALCCTDNGIVLTHNQEGIIMRTDQLSQSSSVLRGMGFLLVDLGAGPSSHSDYYVDLFGKTWYLHRAVLEIRAPGLLLPDVVEKLKRAEAEAFKVDDFKRLIKACYMDSRWDETWIPNNWRAHGMHGEILRRITWLLKLLQLAALINSKLYLESVEYQLLDCFRLSAHQGMVIDTNRSNSTSAAVTSSSSSDKTHIGINILSEIGDVVDSSLRVDVMKLFLPYAATIFRVHNLPVLQVYAAIQQRSDLLNMLISYIQNNRVQKHGASLSNSHEEWHSTWRRQLLVSSHASQSKQTPTPETCQILKYDIEIEGETSKWLCHKWILSKSPFFNILFGSSFSEASDRTWKVAPQSLGGMVLDDEAMGALLDYVYTDDPSRINSLSHDRRASVISVIPFLFLSESDLHLQLIGSR